MATALKIGFIGLGHMGQHMARRLIDAGHEVTVYNRTLAKASEFVAGVGGRLARSAADLGECEFIITMLADDSAVRAVVDAGFLDGEATHVAMSTISVALSRELSERKKYVAAPVLGRPDAAEAGKLIVVAGGELSPEIGTIFTCLSQKIFPLSGPAWQAHLVKLACNFMLTSAVETMAEAFTLVRKGGIEAQEFYELFSTTLFAAPVYKNYGAMIATENYAQPGGFKLPLGAKDVALALTAAKELNVALPIANTVQDRLKKALAQGYEGLDLAGLGKLT